MIKWPTGFKSVSQPTTEDVILTNVPKRVRSILNTDIRVSDFHNLTLASTKLCIARNAPQKLCLGIVNILINQISKGAY